MPQPPTRQAAPRPSARRRLLLCFTLGPILLLFLTGCATLSESECVRGDWFLIGARDARQGFTADRRAEHDKACAKHGVVVDPGLYEEGYREGLRAFCVPARGFELGRAGETYHGQCPPEAERGFLPALRLGMDVHAVEKELEDIDKEIAAVHAETLDEEASEDARKLAERRLRYLENDRARRQRDRDALLDRARLRDYRPGW